MCCVGEGAYIYTYMCFVYVYISKENNCGGAFECCV